MGFWLKLLRPDQPEHPGVLAILVSTAVLIVGLAAIIAVVAYRIFKFGDVGSGTCWCFGLGVIVLATIAGIALKFNPIPNLPQGEQHEDPRP
jgi:hypothetical protein